MSSLEEIIKLGKKRADDGWEGYTKRDITGRVNQEIIFPALQEILKEFKLIRKFKFETDIRISDIEVLIKELKELLKKEI